MSLPLDPLRILRARITARAILWQANAYADIDELMQPLYSYAHTSGLLRTLGTEGVDRMMLAALAERLRSSDTSSDIQPNDEWPPNSHRSSGR